MSIHPLLLQYTTIAYQDLHFLIHEDLVACRLLRGAQFLATTNSATLLRPLPNTHAVAQPRAHNQLEIGIPQLCDLIFIGIEKETLMVGEVQREL